MKTNSISIITLLFLSLIFYSCSKSSSEEKGAAGISWKNSRLIMIHEYYKDHDHKYKVAVDTSSIPDGTIDLETNLTIYENGRVPEAGDAIYLRFTDGNLESAYAEDDVNKYSREFQRKRDKEN